MALKRGNKAQYFYSGLSLQSKLTVDSSANRSIASKNVNEAWYLYELIPNTHTMFSPDRTTPRKVAGIHEIDGLSATNAQLATLTKQVELLIRTQKQGVNVIRATIMCENCGANHSKSDCMLLASPRTDRKTDTLPSNTVTNMKEQVNAITTRSGVQLSEIHVKRPKKNDEQLEIEEEETGQQHAKSKEEVSKESTESSKVRAPIPVKAYVPPISFP
ncbi:Uncharacterized protein Adt_40030 [Abeliophyllum distichum]|uniref:Uncharacterized protein n=1 Tax=Abeliophyllum distichum TaxID=126358 RepID=A0ABD1Q9Y7_9LAMI